MVEASGISGFLEKRSPTLSFEFFPPKDSAGEVNLHQAIDELMSVAPDFVSVTYGAMGSNQDSSVAVVERLSRLVPTIAHLTCVGATKAGISNLLNRYRDFGVAAILALRGDKPRDLEQFPESDYTFALDLVNQVSSSTPFEIGVAAFPEKHPESSSLEADVDILLLKEKAGASFAMTQLFFDVAAYTSLVERARNAGVSMPIVPGVMPISNVRQVLRMAQMSGAAIPIDLENSLSSAESDDHARAIGMEFSAQLARDLLQSGAPGIHIFTLNHSRAALELVAAADLA